MTDIYDDLDGEISASEVIASLQKRIKELEALISQGFQDLKGRDVADALIDNANLSDRIKELEAELKQLRLLVYSPDMENNDS
jgi:prefoldin subunit 5